MCIYVYVYTHNINNDKHNINISIICYSITYRNILDISIVYSMCYIMRQQLREQDFSLVRAGDRACLVRDFLL